MSTTCSYEPFDGFALVSSEESQMSPWVIVIGTALVLNMIILYPTHKWSC